MRSLAVGIVLLTAGAASAIFIRPDLAQVPVDRLAANLKKLVKENPKDVNLLFNLARLHAMAFAEKTDTVAVWRGREKYGAWFGHTPKYVPFRPKKAKTPEEKKKAEKHLREALRLYEEVLKRKPDHLGALLGHAWLVQQMGDKKRAIAEYRKTIDMAWRKEGKLRAGRLGGRYVTVEAAQYLIPLLDKDRDAAEIATLKARVAQLQRLPRPITPIAIPLGDGITPEQFLDRNARVRFDADGSGLQKPWTWIRPNAAWLVTDRQRTGRVSSGLQLFGNVTYWLFWDNGFQALAALDDNGDGALTGSELEGLAIWHDRNANGISEDGEVIPVARFGIVRISCRGQSSTARDVAAWSATGVTFRDGTTRPTFDVILRQQGSR